MISYQIITILSEEARCFRIFGQKHMNDADGKTRRLLCCVHELRSHRAETGHKKATRRVTALPLICRTMMQRRRRGCAVYTNCVLIAPKRDEKTAHRAVFGVPGAI